MVLWNAVGTQTSLIACRHSGQPLMPITIRQLSTRHCAGSQSHDSLAQYRTQHSRPQHCTGA
eukprot:2238340-Rhodomonas_salina.1